ncbi:hypothetical protein M0805_000939 [Coniferiporia weirii]|nr:hypothetical protein M0805_000939 [Coniferiporia weirii]
MRTHMASTRLSDNEQDRMQKRPTTSSTGQLVYQPVYTASPPPPDWPVPKLRLEAKDLAHEGTALFFKHVNPSDGLRNAVVSVLETLYTKQTSPTNVRSVSLYLDDMDGVAYTKGSELDNDHKEIHLSVRHVKNSKHRVRGEVLGVLVHEMVHCFQYNAKGTCPGGLIEGIADYVRLKAGFSPPHWQKGGNKWDEGYQTTGYFLEWIEDTYGHDFVRKLNGAMREQKYSPDVFRELTGEGVDALWKLYKLSLPVPT